jgi:hypothetical protein
MSESIEKFRIEEYKQIRDEIRAREQTIGQLFTVTVTASAAILSAVAAFVFRSDANALAMSSPAYAYAFLGPHALIVPILFSLASHRRDIHRSGTYLHVFYEEAKAGPQWETLLAKYRSLRGGESLNPLPLTFWALWILCTVGFLFALSRIEPLWCSLQWLIASVVVLVSLCLLLVAHRGFRQAATHVRDDYFSTWRQIQKSEGSGSG